MNRWPNPAAAVDAPIALGVLSSEYRRRATAQRRYAQGPLS